MSGFSETPDLRHEGPARRSWAAKLARALLVALVVWAAFTATLALNQDAMIYFPTKLAPDEARSIAAERSLQPWFDSAGETIGYRATAEPGDPRPRASVLLFHGNAGCAADRACYVDLLRAAAPNHALSVFILEYPGYGARSGKPSQETILSAAAGARSILRGEPLIVAGESLGSGVASWVATRAAQPVAGLLFVTPFDSLAAVAQHHYPLLPVRWLLRDKYPSDEWLRGSSCPAAFLLAERDEVVPAAFARRLFASYGGPKKQWCVAGAKHNDIIDMASASEWREAMEFLLPRTAGTAN